MRVAIALLATLALAFCAVDARVLFINQFPHYQTFDNFDNCYYDGTCYENRCDNLKSGWYNPSFQSSLPVGPEIRHWWVSDIQTPSNWDPDRNTIACDQLRTGPCADHTSNVAGEGKFLYAESTACYQKLFDVVTPTFLFNNTGAYLSFYYLARGDQIGASALTVQISIDNGTWTDVFTVAPASSQNWRFVEVTDLDTYLVNASSANPVPATFRFRAQTGTGFYSDLAIDDVFWTQAGAPNTTVPYIEPNITSPPPPIVPSPIVTKEDGDGLTDGEIAGIVVGIVGGACCLCCCLCICLIAMLLIISPRKPPPGGE